MVGLYPFKTDAVINVTNQYDNIIYMETKREAWGDIILKSSRTFLSNGSVMACGAPRLSACGRRINSPPESHTYGAQARVASRGNLGVTQSDDRGAARPAIARRVIRITSRSTI